MKNFTLLTKTKTDKFSDIVSIGDILEYQFDCSPWADDNETVTAATWTVENGTVGISSESVSSNHVSATLTFNQAGKALVSILIQTAGGLQKKMWLDIRIKDEQYPADDYGIANE